MVPINLVVNYVLFWLWGYTGETLLDLISKTWVDDNIRFQPPSCLLKIIDN